MVKKASTNVIQIRFLEHFKNERTLRLRELYYRILAYCVSLLNLHIVLQKVEYITKAP